MLVLLDYSDFVFPLINLTIKLLILTWKENKEKRKKFAIINNKQQRNVSCPLLLRATRLRQSCQRTYKIRYYFFGKRK